ncbi:MAG: ferredoxin family protein [Desulfobaccales bacterium]
MKKDRKQTAAIVIDPKACKGCHLCIDQCPQGVFEVSQTRSPKGYLMPQVAALEACSDCRLCEMLCPDLAITVEGQADEK